jgi:hypothetical protein
VTAQEVARQSSLVRTSAVWCATGALTSGIATAYLLQPAVLSGGATPAAATVVGSAALAGCSVGATWALGTRFFGWIWDSALPGS